MAYDILTLMNQTKFQTRPNIPLYTELIPIQERTATSEHPIKNIKLQNKNFTKRGLDPFNTFDSSTPHQMNNFNKHEKSFHFSHFNSRNSVNKDHIHGLNKDYIHGLNKESHNTPSSVMQLSSLMREAHAEPKNYITENLIEYYGEIPSSNYEKKSMTLHTLPNWKRKQINNGTKNTIPTDQLESQHDANSSSSDLDGLESTEIKSVQISKEEENYMLTKGEQPILSHEEISYEHQRIFDMVNLRCKLANNHGLGSEGNKVGLGNLYLHHIKYHEKYINVYRKGLPHNKNGFVDIDEMSKLITALNERDSNKLSQIKLGSRTRLVNPSAAWSQDLFGGNNNSYRYSQMPSLTSDKMTALMSELYCMSIARDIPFHQYQTSSIIIDCCKYLNSLKFYPQTQQTLSITTNPKRGTCSPDQSNFVTFTKRKVRSKVTPYNIFRGQMYGDLQGIYLSQFLYRDIRMGGILQKQKYTTSLEGYDFMKTWEMAIAVQNGHFTKRCKASSSGSNFVAFTKDNETMPYRDNPRYLITGRDLACYVHSDEQFQTFDNACMILLNMKVPMNPGIVKLSNDNPVEEHFINFGRPDIQATTNMIGRNALSAAWYIKWNSLFLRPEAYGIEVERVFRDHRNKYGIPHELIDNGVINAIRSRNGTALLTQVYGEGSSLHPSTPSGRATVAGACVTALKFFFDTNYEMEVYEPDENGKHLVKTGMKTTVGQELDKLACNIGIGCCWAGVNYYNDVTSGIKLGEKAALSCLRDMIHRYPIHVEIPLHCFNEKITIISN